MVSALLLVIYGYLLVIVMTDMLKKWPELLNSGLTRLVF